jgi:hypothetical protein
MSAATILEEWAFRQHWSLQDQLNIVLQYIENQGDNECFEDHLALEAHADENTQVLHLPPPKDRGPRPA